MENYLGRGDFVTVTAPVGVVSGEGVKVGQLFGVAVHDALINTTLAIAVEGVFILPKASGAITAGALVYWDGTECTTTASGNMLIGSAVVAAGDGDATVKVRLNGAARADES